MDDTDRDRSDHTAPNRENPTVETLIGDARRVQASALFVALITVGAYVAVPLPGTPVPIVLQNAFVVLTGLVLSPGWSLLTVTVYLLIGAIGLPVFAGATGGLAHFAGPTGGFLVGYLPAVVVTAVICSSAVGPSRRDRRSDTSAPETTSAAGAETGRTIRRNRIGTARLVVAIAAGFLVPYLFGVPRLAAVTSLSLPGAISAAMIPFLPGDAFKGVLVYLVLRGIPDSVWQRLR
jgi:biotin transport system substrate-specific component